MDRIPEIKRVTNAKEGVLNSEPSNCEHDRCRYRECGGEPQNQATSRCSAIHPVVSRFPRVG